MTDFDILIVDDEENWRADLKCILEGEGYSVQVASSYSEAKQVLARQTFCLLIADIILRPTNPADRGGLQLLREVRESFRNVGLIAISGYDVPEVAEEFGPRNFFDKRCLDTQKLREQVQKLVQGTVLVIEDEDNWVEIYQGILTEEGFSVRVAQDFGRACGELGRGFFRAVILDLCLGGSRDGSDLYGMQLLESISDAGIPVLIITGYATPKLVKEIYHEYGVFSIGEKRTFDSDEFRKLIKEAVETRVELIPGPLSSEEGWVRREKKLQELVAAVLHEGELPAETSKQKDSVVRVQTVDVRRFTDVCFPEQCRIYQPVRLTVQLTLKSVQVEIDIPAGMPRPLPPSEILVEPTPREIEERRVELVVFVSADSFEIDRRWRKLSVPFGQDSEKVEFELVGQKLGPQIVEIEFFHGTARVGYVVAETRVVEGDTLGQDAQVTYEAVDDRVWSGIPEQPTATVIANWQEDKGIDYWILEENTRIPVDGGFIPVTSGKEAVVGFWEDLSDLLGEAVQLSGLPENELDSIWLNIRGLGQELGNKLLPAELQSHSSTWPVSSIIVIATNEQWIPWELIYDGDDFWGNKFVLARVPKIPGQSAFLASDRAVERYVSTQLHKVINVIGGELRPSQIVERVRELFIAFRANVSIETVERATLAEVFRSIVDADLVHFTCHGHTTPRPCLQLADDRSLIRCLTPSNLQDLPQLADSVIFANACTSAVITSFLGELRNFGWEFYKKGAAAYIGTLGLVPTEYAVAFAERFYERLLDGHTVGESLHYAKSKAERENPFWLLYILYGDPFARKPIQPQCH